MLKVDVKCARCKKIFSFPEQSPLHMSHKDTFIICSECENEDKEASDE